MKLKNNKKATEMFWADKMLFMMLFLIVIGVTASAFIWIIDYFVSGYIQIPKNVEETIMIERFYNSPFCFAYQDATGRTYAQIIDFEKFSSKDALDKCLTNPDIIAFKLEISHPSTSGKVSIKTSNFAENSNFHLVQKDVDVYYNGKIKGEKFDIYVQNI